MAFSRSSVWIGESVARAILFAGLLMVIWAPGFQLTIPVVLVGVVVGMVFARHRHPDAFLPENVQYDAESDVGRRLRALDKWGTPAAVGLMVVCPAIFFWRYLIGHWIQGLGDGALFPTLIFVPLAVVAELYRLRRRAVFG